MNKFSNPLRLSLPEQQAPRKGSFDARPRAVEAWVNGLPLANIGESAKQVYNALVELNGLTVKPEDRFADGELIRPVVRLVSESLRKHYINQPGPLSGKNRRIVELGLALRAQIAILYKIIAVEGSLKGGRIATKFGSTSIHRALRYLGTSLLQCYEVYVPVPAGLWRDIHELHRYARACEWHMTPVEDSVLSDANSTTISDAYQQILLMATASPYQLLPGEVWKLYHMLEGSAQFSELKQTSSDMHTGTFFIRPEEDNPPLYSELRQDQHASDTEFLDTSGLIDMIRDELLRAQEPVKTISLHGQANLSPDLLRRLMLMWGAMPERRFARMQKKSAVRVAIGLSAAFQFIDESQRANQPEAGLDADDDTQEITSESNPHPLPQTDVADRTMHAMSVKTEKAVDVWDKAYRPTEPQRPARAVPPPVLKEKRRSPPKYVHHTWNVVDVSAGGFRLEWNRDERIPAQVGDILAIQEVDGDKASPWRVGVIRWMKCSKRNHLEVGAQVLAPSAVAIKTLVCKKAGSRGTYERSLLLPEIRAVGQAASLITPALHYEVGSKVIMNLHGKEMNLGLLKLLESMGTAAQFTFSRLEAPEVQAEHPHEEATKRFDSLWSSLNT